MRRLLLALAVMAPVFALDSAPASAWGWDRGYGSYGYAYAPYYCPPYRSYYYTYRPYYGYYGYRPYYGAYWRPRFGGYFYRPYRSWGYRGWGYRGWGWGHRGWRRW
jgi:hypothetical protein